MRNLHKTRLELLRDRSDFSFEAVRREFHSSIIFKFDKLELDILDTQLIRKVISRNESSILQINLLPEYPPLECEFHDCSELADFLCLIVPSHGENENNANAFVGFPKDDIEHKINGCMTFICVGHIDDIVDALDSNIQ